MKKRRISKVGAKNAAMAQDSSDINPLDEAINDEETEDSQESSEIKSC